MTRWFTSQKSLTRTVALLALVALPMSCAQPVTGTYENVNGFAALKLEKDGSAKLTVYGEELPCPDYTATTEKVTLKCVPVSIEFKRRGNQLVNDMPFDYSYRSNRRFPFRGPIGTNFGEFHKTGTSN
jgi:hypothetical protein